MNKNTNNNGITLIALAITVIVLIILASVGTYSGISALRDSKENAQISELGMVQQAVIENYTKYQMVKDINKEAVDMYFIGKAMNYSEVENIINEINEKIASDEEPITLKIQNDYGTVDETDKEAKEKYYYLLRIEDLEELGISQAEGETYIVNYSTGEVINQELKVTRTGKPLYIYAKDNI